MFNSLEIMKMAQGMAVHAAQRQSLIAENIANADTPRYRAQDMTAFADAYRGEMQGRGLHATRPGHITSASSTHPANLVFDAAGAETPNGNTVSLETEMVRATEVRHQHDMALSIYKTSLDVLRASIGRR